MLTLQSVDLICEWQQSRPHIAAAHGYPAQTTYCQLKKRTLIPKLVTSFSSSLRDSHSLSLELQIPKWEDACILWHTAYPHTHTHTHTHTHAQTKQSAIYQRYPLPIICELSPHGIQTRLHNLQETVLHLIAQNPSIEQETHLHRVCVRITVSSSNKLMVP
jgi:hypothetical protein